MIIKNYCICGKCKITCNLHGKRGKCAKCGKRRLLGTIVDHGSIIYACGECCVKQQRAIDDEENKEIFKKFRGKK